MTLVQMVMTAVQAADKVEEEICQDCRASDGGLTHYGSDQIADNTSMFREVLGLLVDRLKWTDAEFTEKMRLLAYPGWDEDSGEAIEENYIAKALLLE